MIIEATVKISLSGAGYAGIKKGVGLTFAYLASERTSPRYPWFPQPRSVSTLLALARNSALSRFNAL